VTKASRGRGVGNVHTDLSILPEPQRQLRAELRDTSKMFELYGGTAPALRPGHRQAKLEADGGWMEHQSSKLFWRLENAEITAIGRKGLNW
jgi:hypothetical protein